MKVHFKYKRSPFKNSVQEGTYLYSKHKATLLSELEIIPINSRLTQWEFSS